MANVKITDLGAYTNPVSTDVLPIVDVSADSTKKVSIADLLENAGSGTAAAPGIAFDGDSDTGIYRPGANQVAISTNGAERARIDSSGRLLVGTSSVFGAYPDGLFVNASNGLTCQFGRFTNDINSGHIGLFSGRGGNPGTRGIVINNDFLGIIDFVGDDGTTLSRPGARISAQVDGIPGTDDMPGRLVFSVTADGSASPTEQLRITSDRYVRLASGTGGIQFNGDTAAANALDDYEEGTWTVTIYDASSGGNASASTGTGYYTKIGRCVSCVFTNISDINTTGMTAGNIVYVSLPFASTIGVSSGGSIFIEGMTLPSSNTNVMPVVNGNSGRFLLYAGGASGGPRTAITVQDLTSGTTDFRYFELTYFI